jgi:hypothetical protein
VQVPCRCSACERALRAASAQGAAHRSLSGRAAPAPKNINQGPPAPPRGSGESAPIRSVRVGARGAKRSKQRTREGPPAARRPGGGGAPARPTAASEGAPGRAAAAGAGAGRGRGRRARPRAPPSLAREVGDYARAYLVLADVVRVVGLQLRAGAVEEALEKVLRGAGGARARRWRRRVAGGVRPDRCGGLVRRFVARRAPCGEGAACGHSLGRGLGVRLCVVSPAWCVVEYTPSPPPHLCSGVHHLGLDGGGLGGPGGVGGWVGGCVGWEAGGGMGQGGVVADGVVVGLGCCGKGSIPPRPSREQRRHLIHPPPPPLPSPPLAPPTPPPPAPPPVDEHDLAEAAALGAHVLVVIHWEGGRGGGGVF